MSAVLAIAGADAAERTRRFTFLVIVAMAVYAGYLYVPEAHASYGTVTIDDHRGVYNSAYVGAAIALLTSSFLSLIGFFFVRGSVQRDWDLHTDQLVAAAPARRSAFLLGKWASNLVVLLAVAAITYAASIGMQEWHGEDRAFNLAAYLLPYLIVTVPSMAFISAVAVIFDAVPVLRGIVGGIIYVVLIWTTMLVVPFQQSSDFKHHAWVDPLGATEIVFALHASERAAFPGEKDRLDVSIGGTPAPKGGFTRYRFDGIAWTAQEIGMRALWIAISMGLVVAASPLFDLFRRDRSRDAREQRTIDVARILPDLPLLRTLRAEFVLLVNGAPLWWFGGAAILAVLTGVLASKSVTDFLLPVALIWPLERLSSLGVRERQYAVFDILAATRGFTSRTMLVQWIAGTMLSSLLVCGFLVRLIVSGDAVSAAAVVVMLAAIVALALALGTVSANARSFQACFLILWYLGPIQHLPGLDIAMQAQHHPAASIAIAALLTVTALAVALVAQRRAVR